MLDEPMRGQPPKNWLVESILVTIFCCLPFGLVGLVHASQVESRFFLCDIEGAERAAFEARKWTMVAMWVGISVIVLYFLFIGVIMSFASSFTNGFGR